MESVYDPGREAVKLLAFSILLMMVPAAASNREYFAPSGGSGKSGSIMQLIASPIDVGIRSKHVSGQGTPTDPSGAVELYFGLSTANASDDAIRSTGQFHVAPPSDGEKMMQSLERQRALIHATDQRLKRKESLSRGLQMVQSQTLGVDIATSSGEAVHQGLTANRANNQARAQSQHVVLNGSGTGAVPQQLNLSQVLIQNSSQFFLNWEQPRGQQGGSGTSSANADQQYDWKKHVQHQPGRGRREALSKQQQITEQKQQQKLLAEVFLLGKEVDSRQQHLAEQQKLRQQLQTLVAMQLELLKQLRRLEQEQQGDGHQSVSQRVASSSSPDSACYLKDFPLADSFAQVKRQSQLLLAAPLPVPRVTFPLLQRMWSASGTKETGYPIPHSIVQQFTLPVPSEQQADHVHSRQPQSTTQQLALTSQLSRNPFLAPHEAGSQTISTSGVSDDNLRSTAQLLKDQKLSTALINPPKQYHGEAMRGIFPEIPAELAQPSVAHNSTETVSSELKRNEVTREELPLQQRLDVDTGVPLDAESENGASGATVASDISVILTDAVAKHRYSSQAPVSSGLVNPPSGRVPGEREQQHPSRTFGEANESKATENAEAKEQNRESVLAEDKEPGKQELEELKSPVKTSQQERKVDDIHEVQLQHNELRALQKQQQDHLAMLLKQVRLQQEELAARSRLLEEQHQELVLMREHLRQITARSRLPDAKRVKLSNVVLPEGSHLLAVKNVSEKQESNSEATLQSKGAPPDQQK
ncbi:conserved hypothetical protein [Neospora caninum Liverpool]|uniref:Uncharacterized protein n=1 Tax=Neospora caninum (strain Liverpool) TaxID=572307 RepID=F0VH07_NEOCL|nr:conserved hypothetical protein [Neospora caninum Liverpool]CBZ53001.1 conserved hypothetical protein [Neospora caninum Liverpool]CEL66986.1 TPA: hypothetical protein BN1204_027900 [Neospora caninum Liverpool]|eukprot:XP_003883033.1 conserved hypothetical protein [Neospora caninum Liverpool]